MSSTSDFYHLDLRSSGVLATDELKSKISYQMKNHEINLMINQSLDKPLKILLDQSEISLKVRVHHEAQASIISELSAKSDLQKVSVNLVLDKNTKLGFYTLSNRQKNTQYEQKVKLAEGSCLDLMSDVNESAQFFQNIHVLLEEPRAQVSVDGCYNAKGSQKMKFQSLIEHKVGHCVSRQLYKGVISDDAKTEFDAKIIIHQNCEGASSEQLNKNLLLSRTAEAKSHPQLEIYTDDVQATHGSTTGQLDAEEIFYFQSRGIRKDEAVQLVSHGFLHDVLDRISEYQVRDWFKNKG